MANSHAEVPACKAILLCDKTILEAGTGKVSLIGVFERFLVDESLTTAPCEAFTQITNAVGRYEIVFEIRDLQENETIARAVGLAIQIPNPLFRANVIIPVPALRFNHTGTYDLVMLANGQEIDRQQFAVARRPGETNDDDSRAERQDS